MALRSGMIGCSHLLRRAGDHFVGKRSRQICEFWCSTLQIEGAVCCRLAHSARYHLGCIMWAASCGGRCMRAIGHREARIGTARACVVRERALSAVPRLALRVSTLMRVSTLICAGLLVVTGDVATRSSAVARDYSLHMLAHVASRCTLHRTASYVVPVSAGAEQYASSASAAGVRIACNVPYQIQFSRNMRPVNGELGPVAARTDAVDSFDLAVVMPGLDGEISGRCSSEELAQESGGCAPASSNGDAQRLAPVGIARIAMFQPEQQMFDFPFAYMPSIAPGQAGSPARQTHLRVVLSASY